MEPGCARVWVCSVAFLFYGEEGKILVSCNFGDLTGSHDGALSVVGDQDPVLVTHDLGHSQANQFQPMCGFHDGDSW